MDAQGEKLKVNGWGLIAVKWILAVLGISLVTWVLYRNVSTLVLLAVSFLLSYLLDPVITKLQKRNVPRAVSITVLIAILLVAMTVFSLILVPQITSQTASLLSKYYPESMKVAEIPSTEGDTQPAKLNFVKWFDQNINPLLVNLGLEAWDTDDVRGKIREILMWVDSHYPQWGQSIWSVFQSMFTGVANFIVGILNLILVPVFTFYLLRDYPVIRESFYSGIPPAWRAPVKDWLRELDQVVGGFIRGQFSIALILAVINAVGLMVLGVPFGFLIGTIAGLANMVPYMSIAVGLIPALFFSFLDQPDVWRLVWVAAVFSGAQMLEGLYLSPRIMGQEVGLHPVLIMLAIIVGGSLFGLTGIILAVPLAAILKVVVVRVHLRWKKQWIHLR